MCTLRDLNLYFTCIYWNWKVIIILLVLSEWCTVLTSGYELRIIMFKNTTGLVIKEWADRWIVAPVYSTDKSLLASSFLISISYPQLCHHTWFHFLTCISPKIGLVDTVTRLTLSYTLYSTSRYALHYYKIYTVVWTRYSPYEFYRSRWATWMWAHSRTRL